MLPHTGLFLLGKVALQMRIRRRLKFQAAFLLPTDTVSPVAKAMPFENVSL